MPYRLIKEVRKLLAQDFTVRSSPSYILTEFKVAYPDETCDQIDRVLYECAQVFEGRTPTDQQRNRLARHGIEVKHDIASGRVRLVTEVGQLTL